MSGEFKRTVYWNKYKVIPNKQVAPNEQVRELLDASYKGVTRLFFLAYNDVANDASQLDDNSFQKYFLPRVQKKIPT